MLHRRWKTARKQQEKSAISIDAREQDTKTKQQQQAHEQEGKFDLAFSATMTMYAEAQTALYASAADRTTASSLSSSLFCVSEATDVTKC